MAHPCALLHPTLRTAPLPHLQAPGSYQKQLLFPRSCNARYHGARALRIMKTISISKSAPPRKQALELSGEAVSLHRGGGAGCVGARAEVCVGSRPLLPAAWCWAVLGLSHVPSLTLLPVTTRGTGHASTLPVQDGLQMLSTLRPPASLGTWDPVLTLQAEGTWALGPEALTTRGPRCSGDVLTQSQMWLQPLPSPFTDTRWPGRETGRRQVHGVVPRWASWRGDRKVLFPSQTSRLRLTDLPPVAWGCFSVEEWTWQPPPPRQFLGTGGGSGSLHQPHSSRGRRPREATPQRQVLPFTLQPPIARSHVPPWGSVPWAWRETGVTVVSRHSDSGDEEGVGWAETQASVSDGVGGRDRTPTAS